MEKNNICTAPQIMDVDAAFAVWSRTNGGGKAAFYKFMTTPSVERDAFTDSYGYSISIEAGAAVITLQVQ